MGNDQRTDRQAVITGLGMVSPIGIGRHAFWESIQAGRSGVHAIRNFNAGNMVAPFGGEILGFDAKEYVRPRKSLKVMSDEIRWAFAAADLACTDAKLPEVAAEPERFGVVFGCDMIYSDIEELVPAYRKCLVDGQFDYAKWGEQALGEMYPLWMLKNLPNMPACHIGIARDARGPTNSITLGDASSLLAITEAVRVIERGDADVIIAGGTGTRLHPAALAYRGGQYLSRREDMPEAASRPFEARRDGMVNGQGAGAIVLESREHAERRGAKTLARVVACSSTFEPRASGQVPQGTAIRAAIRNVLRQAGLQPEAIGHVNAHGLSTVEHDPSEARAIQSELGDVPVTALKSYFGNLGAGSGAVELAASVLALETGEIPRTLNYEEPDPNCPVRIVAEAGVHAKHPTALVLSQSLMGQSAAILLAAE